MKCSAADVFAVLGDGWLFGLWVVGASRMREVDTAWPETGSTIHHSVGVWPFLIDDSTSVTEFEPDRKLSLRARAWPVGEAQVIMELEPITGDSCRVTMTETAVSGPAQFVPSFILDPLLDRRNVESLRRLSYLAERRAARSTSPDPHGA
jgi:hypothetical protein